MEISENMRIVPASRLRHRSFPTPVYRHRIIITGIPGIVVTIGRSIIKSSLASRKDPRSQCAVVHAEERNFAAVDAEPRAEEERDDSAARLVSKRKEQRGRACTRAGGRGKILTLRFPKRFAFNANYFTAPLLPVGAMYVCTLYAILFLKLWSYVQVNMWCRTSSRKKTTPGRMRRQLSYNNLQCEYTQKRMNFFTYVYLVSAILMLHIFSYPSRNKQSIHLTF